MRSSTCNTVTRENPTSPPPYDRSSEVGESTWKAPQDGGDSFGYADTLGTLREWARLASRADEYCNVNEEAPADPEVEALLAYLDDVTGSFTQLFNSEVATRLPLPGDGRCRPLD